MADNGTGTHPTLFSLGRKLLSQDSIMDKIGTLRGNRFLTNKIDWDRTFAAATSLGKG
jgi:hypothetical protein